MMTEANLDLQPSWPSYESHKQVYYLHSSARSVHNSDYKAGLHVFTYCDSAHKSKKKTAIHLLNLQLTAGLRIFMYCDSSAT